MAFSFFKIAPVLFLLFASVLASKCFYYDGAPIFENSLCPGSNACCGPTATCESTRLCHNEDDPPDVFVRGPCSIESWDLAGCPQLCLYDEKAGVFPRVKQCPDQSYCCSNSTGSAVIDDVKDCCEKGAGVFLFEGQVVSSAPSASATGASSTSATGASGTQANNNAGISSGAKIGIGVGIAVAVLLLIVGAVVICLRRRKRQARDVGTAKEYPMSWTEQSVQPKPISELHSTDRFDTSAHTFEMGESKFPPAQELASDPPKHRSELP